MLPSFTSRKFSYANPSLPATKTLNHPLLTVQHVDNTATLSEDDPRATTENSSPNKVTPKPISKKDSFIDPLSDPLSNPLASDPLSDDFADPLSDPLSSMPSISTMSLNTPPSPPPTALSTSSIPPLWSIYKTSILKSYQVTSVKVTAAFMNDEDNVEAVKAVKSVDRTKERLKQLTETGSDEKMQELTQSEYTSELQRLHKEISRAWIAGERVLSIKLVIKCTKLLADATTAPQFYPTVFVIVTEILDTFGKLVYDRIKAKAEEDPTNPNKRKRLPANFTADDVNVNACETCRNWFYKISSVRELLPRLYLEMCLLPCYAFLSKTEYPAVLKRLASSLRGIGDPLVSVYAGVYLTKTGAIVAPDTTAYADAVVQDYLFMFQDYGKGPSLDTFKSKQIYANIEHFDYLHLHSPAVDWIMGRASKGAFKATIKGYRDHCGNSMVLGWIVEKFDAGNYKENAAAMVTLAKQSALSKTGLMGVFAKLAHGFQTNPPPPDQRLLVLNEVWKVVTKCDDIAQYIMCAKEWLEVVVLHYSSLELNVLMRDIVKHLQNSEEDEVLAKALDPLVQLLVRHSYDYNGAILKSGELLQILDKFKNSHKADHSKELLETFNKNSDETNDPVLINTLFEVSRALHDSLDSLSPEGEQRHVASLINGFIEKIDFGKDFERQLNTYVECRSAFANLDDVKERLILCVNRLSMRTLTMVKGRHSKKTQAFVKGCLAFNHITIPSIDNTMTRLNLLVYCGIVGLKNACLPQCDTFLKAAISLVPEAGSSAQDVAAVVQWVGLFCGLLVMVPGSPEFGPFYLMHGLMKAIGKWSSEDGGGGEAGGGSAAVAAMNAAMRRTAKAKCLMIMVGTCSAWAQNKLPYGVPGVDSNDTLYGGGKDYMEELDELIKSILSESVADIEATAEGSLKDELMLGLVETLTTFFEADDVCLKVAKNMVKKVEKGEGGGGKWKPWLVKVKGNIALAITSRQ